MKATGSQVELDKTSPGPVPWSFLLTAGLVALIALAVGTTDYYLASIVIASISGLTGVFRVAFRGSRAFCLTLANLAGVYACIFLFFAETDFRGAGALALSVGFILPLTAFVLGSFWHREAIVRVAISGQLREQRHLGRILTWLAPVFAIGVLASLVPASIAAGSENAVLLVAMLAISAIIVFVSRDIAVFLLDTGLLFEEFFHGWRASSCRPSPSSPAIRCS
jgi:voltage-gated potassium channel